MKAYIIVLPNGRYYAGINDYGEIMITKQVSKAYIFVEPAASKLKRLVERFKATLLVAEFVGVSDLNVELEDSEESEEFEESGEAGIKPLKFK